MENNNIIIKNIDGRDVRYRNFAGNVSQYNSTGAKKFNLVLNEDIALDLLKRGFNVHSKELDNGDIMYSLDVFINYGNYSPNIYAIAGDTKKLLDDKTIKSLQGADIIKADLCIRPYHWKAAGNKSGIKAYVKYMYVTIEVDPFADEYAYLDHDGLEDEFDYEEE